MKDYSVLMSVYAGENSEFLSQSIESMIKQTVPSNNFVLVCDGSLTNELDLVVARYESENPDVFHVVRLEKNVGLAMALNAGLKHCENEYVARMDSDDIASPNRMQKQLDAINDADILGCYVSEFTTKPGDSQTVRVVPTNQEDIKAFARRRNPFNHPSVLYKKSSVLQAGGYEKFPLCEDYHLWIKMLLNGCTAVNISEPLVYMRVGSGMHKRRGGWAYFKSMLNFRRWMRQAGFSSLSDFWFCAAGHFVSCLIPKSMRKWMYNKFLRKQNNF